MSDNLFATLPRFVKDMDTDELEDFFPPGLDEDGKPYYTKSFLMRSIIMNEKRYGNTYESRTLRAMWYSSVKPTLDKLGLLEASDMSEASLTQWDKTLSRYVCDLLRRGYLTFSDLGIYDTSRKKSTPMETFYSVGSQSSYAYKGRIAPYPNILIATEKDTVYDIISQLANLFGLSCISCKGQNALGAMERIIYRMTTSGIDFDEVIILTLTDMIRPDITSPRRSKSKPRIYWPRCKRIT